MSSILDALKKVEQERTIVARENKPIIESVAAPSEPAASSPSPGKGMIQLSPISAIAGVVVLVVVVTAVAVGVSLTVVKSTAVPPPSRATVPSVSPKSPEESVPETNEQALSTVESGPPMKETEATAIVVPVPVVSRTDSEAAFREPAIQVAETSVRPPAPEAAAAEVDQTRPKEEPGGSSTPEPDREPAEPRRRDTALDADPRPEPVKVDQLPVLTDRMRTSLDLPKFEIRFIGTPTSRNPRSWAVVNMERIYIDNYVPGTDAKVIAIELNGIGIEIEGKQFFVEK